MGTDVCVTGAVQTGLFSYPSANGESTIQAIVWHRGLASLDFGPEGQGVKAAFEAARPRAVVQLIHGMGEHIRRYDRFARYLAAQGFLVCGNDQIGHGLTAGTPERYGVLPGADPVNTMVEDVDGLRRAMQAHLPDGLPYLMFGHSMGSLVVRCYIARHGRGLAGAVACGTTMPPRIVSKIGYLASRAFVRLRGPEAKSRVLHRLAYGVYSHKIKGARTPFDWISSDPEAVDAFIADEAAGFMFSGAVYEALTDAACTAARRKTFRDTPDELPVLLIGGDEDPVGDDGKMVERVGWRLRKAGVESVTVKLYGGMRHEVLNEVGYEEVYADVVSWFDAVLGEPASSVSASR